MKKIILIIFSILTISCAKTKNEKQITLNGKYSIVDFRMTPESSKDAIDQKELIVILEGSDYKFDFSPIDGIVRIDSAFGMEYFGDSIFEYKIDSKFIALSNPDKKIHLPYRNDDGILRLLIDKKGIELFTITPTKK
ncbi:hypothetical protein [Winogradskyella immobilis]|uniref:Lipoprotein n=1 Tax=Winogradskyella immobilis TaxID=2816852 RepID=A0ABS8EJ73_9FLAO|nr:hypothetical protein [Winogradskyella immobilis]MCC1483092.1 hypothetical protein [Winogradskyella immobilis]MCG0015187.1 hypothetical protein [Winogradskyella immobilis]